MKVYKRPMMETVIQLGPVEVSTRDLRAFADFFLSLMLLYFGYQLGMNNALRFGDIVKQYCPGWNVTVEGTHVEATIPGHHPGDLITPTIPISGNQYIPPPG